MKSNQSRVVYRAEEVGFGGSIQQVSRYVNGGGSEIVRQFTGEGYEANRAAAIAFAAEMNAAATYPDNI